MFSLTTPQKNIWNLQKYFETSSISNICGAILYNELYDAEVLKKAINKTIKFQAGLRLRFREENGMPVQYVFDYAPIDFDVMRFDSFEEYTAFAKKYSAEPIGMIETQLHKFTIFEVEGSSGIIFKASHLVTDAWSYSLIAKSVSDNYNAFISGEDITDKSYTYIDYIESEQKYFESSKYKKDKAYWEEKYHNKPDPSPIKMITVPVSAPTAKRYTHVLCSDNTAKINAFCDEKDVSQAVLFESAIFAYLSKINDENKSITIGIPVLNRSGAKEKNIAGMFISTTPLTVDIDTAMTMSELCKAITDGHFSMFRHLKYPYSHILCDLREKHNFEGNLYDVMVSFQNSKTDTGAKTIWYSNGYSEVPFAFHIDNRDSADSYTLTIDYQTEVFNEEEIVLLTNRILGIIEQMILDPSISIEKVSIIPRNEYRTIINDFNDTAVDYPKDKCVHELFMEQVEKNPDEIALVFKNNQFTYKQLNEMSNSFAHYLREKGVKPNDVVPIIAKRSWHIIVAMLGILKAGGAYMPVDPTYPIDRIEYMFETTNVAIAAVFGYDNPLHIDTIDLGFFDYSEHAEAIESANCSDNLCYIIFTSGSTGKPKGVALTHRNVANYCNNNDNNNVCHNIIKGNYNSIVSVTNIIFDIFVTESLLPLVSGITIYFADDIEVFSQSKLSELISKNNINVIQTTPTKMKSYILDKKNTDYLSTLKIIVLGGEALPTDLYLELKQYTDAEIYNIYGPAEATVWSTNKRIDDIDITIGKPIANTRIYILDKDRKPLPIGVAGELCISGDGVGKGYLNRLELTAEKFIPNPFIKGKTMYCTGDLARWRTDGEIEYLGRIDTQVKIRGLRIELGEIESVMSSFDGIYMTAVTDKRDENDRQYLVGYYTADNAIDEKALRHHLSAKMPKYMVPNYFVHLEEMPMTASGKTDRKNLPLPDFSVSRVEYVAPGTKREKQLCGVLCELFSMEQISVTDDFFDIGGDSLKAIEYVAKAHTAGVEFALQNVFDYPTVRELCNFLENGAEKEVRYTPADFKKYEKILNRNVIDKSFVPEKKPLGNVLLTGATGFLGAHILDNLMQNETGKIYCLVRSNSPDDRRERLLQLLNYYFGDKYDREIGNKIVPAVGDITIADLSADIPDDIQTVIHTAATVKHYGSYEYFRNINVEGTKNVVNFAKRVGAKLIHISTLSVSGDTLFDQYDYVRSSEFRQFAETDYYIGQDLSNVYVRSKFEAEREILDAILDGLDAKIIRVGNLVNRLSDGLFQKNHSENAFFTRMCTFFSLKKFPRSMDNILVDVTPVDDCAGAVVAIAQQELDNYTIFHLNKKYPISYLLNCFKNIGINFEFISNEEFAIIIKTFLENHTELMPMHNDLDNKNNVKYDVNLETLNEFTHWYLKAIGYNWYEIATEYVRKFVNWFKFLGYLDI